MKDLRKYGPTIHKIGHVALPPYQRYKLDNGVPVYAVSQGTQEIIKIEIVFQSGRTYEHKRVVSRACNNQLKEGTQSMKSKELVDKVDYYGASLRSGENLDSCSISLFCLGKHFATLLPILQEVVMRPTFPEEELRKYVETNAERLKVELVKNDVIAYRKITEAIFTDSHPYGYNSEISDYLALERGDLLQHYDANYGSNNCLIFLSGMVKDEHIRACNTYFGKGFRQVNAKEEVPHFKASQVGKVEIESDQDFQTAIKIGKKLFNRKHQDYPGMYVLNAILGGYFGSRLMSNIREEKGYTYNIYSEVDVMKHDGLFMVGTEVSSEYAEQTISEIFKEISLLKNDLVGEDEMDMVRNYLLGRILNFIDGPFNTGRLLKSIVLSGLEDNYFDNLLAQIRNVTPTELRVLANRYLQEEDMWIVRVG